jgi:hypothetical protein
LLTLEETRRYARQIALPEVGAEGQARIRAARVVIVGDHDGATRAAGDYLRAAGVGQVGLVSTPTDASGWLEALTGASLVLRFSFDDEPLLRTAVRLGIPALIGVAHAEAVDLFAFRRHGPCPHQDREIPVRVAAPGAGSGPAPIILATLAVGEALQLLVNPQAPPRARLLRLALAPEGPAALVQEIPWAPECFVCGGRSPEARPA